MEKYFIHFRENMKMFTPFPISRHIRSMAWDEKSEIIIIRQNIIF